MPAYSVPLTSRFRGIDRREGLLIEGPAGWSEFSPFHEYDDETSLPWLAAALESATLPYPDPLRDEVPVNVTVPAVGPERAHQIVTRSGCTTAKVKVAEPGQTPAEEEARLEAVRDALGADGAIRVDANGGWEAEVAPSRIRALDRAAGGLQYVEQPCARVEDLAAVRRRAEVPIAADESIRRASDPLRVVELDAADVVVLKVQPLGGVRACLNLAELVGLPVVVSSALECSIGIASGVALAAALPAEMATFHGAPLANGLATVNLFGAHVAAAPLLPVGGMLPAGRLTPDEDGRARWAATPDVTAWWHDRARRVAALLPTEERAALLDLLAS